MAANSPGRAVSMRKYLEIRATCGPTRDRKYLENKTTRERPVTGGLVNLLRLVVAVASTCATAVCAVAATTYSEVRTTLMADLGTGNRTQSLNAASALARYLRDGDTRELAIRDLAQVLAKVGRDYSWTGLTERARGAYEGDASYPRVQELMVAVADRFETIVRLVEDERLIDLCPLLLDYVYITRTRTAGIDPFPLESNFPAYAALKRMKVGSADLVHAIESSTDSTARALQCRILWELLGRDTASRVLSERLHQLSYARERGANAEEEGAARLMQCLAPLANEVAP